MLSLAIVPLPTESSHQPAFYFVLINGILYTYIKAFIFKEWFEVYRKMGENIKFLNIPSHFLLFTIVLFLVLLLNIFCDLTFAYCLVLCVFCFFKTSFPYAA